MAGNGKNGNSNGIIERRRRLISSMLLRRPNITRRELMDKVGEQVWNPDTGAPYSLGTIQNDIDALKSEWRERSGSEFDEWVSEQLATLDELQGDAWRERDYAIVLRCIQERAKLKGLYAPERLEADHTLRVEYVNDWRNSSTEPA